MEAGTGPDSRNAPYHLPLREGRTGDKDMQVDIETILILLLMAFIFGMVVGIMLVRPPRPEH